MSVVFAKNKRNLTTFYIYIKNNKIENTNYEFKVTKSNQRSHHIVVFSNVHRFDPFHDYIFERKKSKSKNVL